MADKTNFETIETLRAWFIASTNSETFNADTGTLDMSLLAWAFDSTEFETNGCTPETLVDCLERIDCAGCNAPSGLIYNHDIAAKASDWWNEIDSALWDYQDATGEKYSGRDDVPLTVGDLVWFAVEWRANELASLIRSIADFDE